MRTIWVFFYYYYLGFTQRKAEQPLQGMELQEKKRKRWKTYKKAVTQLLNIPVENVILACMTIVLKHIKVINSKEIKSSNTHTTGKNHQF